MFSVLLLTLDTTPAGHFFSQTQSPCHVDGKASLNQAQRNSSMNMSGEAHLIHSHVGAVGRGGQVAAPRHRVVRRLHVQLAPQDAFIIQLLLKRKEDAIGIP